jgi:hypothetical protein
MCTFPSLSLNRTSNGTTVPGTPQHVTLFIPLLGTPGPVPGNPPPGITSGNPPALNPPPAPNSVRNAVPGLGPTPTRPRPPTVKMDGLNTPMQTTANVTTTEGQIIYPKIVRSTMTQEKLATLFTVATKKHHALYDFMPLTLSDEDKLDDTNSLEMLINQTYHRNFEFEMHDVLQNIMIVDPNDPEERDINYRLFSRVH